jgi:ankyrin repeat protein
LINHTARFFGAAVQLDVILQQTTITGIREALDDIQDTPPVVTALQSIDRQSDHRQALARNALVWVANLKWPLSIAGLCEALALPSINHTISFKDNRNQDLIPIQNVLLGSCQGLLIKDPSSLTVALAQHDIQQSVLAHWSSPSKKRVPDLTEMCLKYLLLEDFEQTSCHTEMELRQILQEYNFLEYAAHCWFPSDINEDVQKKLVNRERATSGGLFTREDDMRESLTLQLLERERNLSLALLVFLFSKSPANLDEMAWREIKDKASTMSGLQVAAHFGMAGATAALLDRGHNPSAKDFRGQTALHEAAREGHLEVVKILVSAMTHLEIADKSGKLPIHYAIEGAQARSKNGDLEGEQRYNTIFQLLMQDCVQKFVRRSIETGTAPLRPPEVRLSEANPGPGNEDGTTSIVKGAFMPALLSGVRDRDSILDRFVSSNRLYSSGMSTDDFEKEYRYAVDRRDLAFVVVLLEKGVNPNATDEKKIPVLHLAIRTGSEEIVHAILGRKGDPSICNGNLPEESALQCAVRFGNIRIVQNLLSTCAEVEYHDKDNASALSYAIRKENKTLVRLLLDYCASLHTKNPEKPTVLFDAVDINEASLVQVLLDQAVDLEKMNKEGCTVLFEAVKKNNRPMIKLLLQNGADVFAMNKAGERVLHAAVQVGDLETIEEIVRCLLNSRRGKHVLQLPNGEGQTPAESLTDPAKRKAYVDYLKTRESF